MADGGKEDGGCLWETSAGLRDQNVSLILTLSR